ncbi:uncharacterized protein LOC120328018 [Styela clava]
MAPLNNCSATPLIGKISKVEGAMSVTVAKASQVCESSSEEIGSKMLDLNHNEVKDECSLKPCVEEEKPAPKRPSLQDIKARTRRMIFNMFNKHLNTNLNVLVIGQRGAGKTSLINSMSMALTQKWSDKAKYCPGRNHVIDECVLHKNESGGKVVFADTRGFEDIHETDHAVLILRYVFEGRIPAKCIPCVLLMNKELIKKRYHKSYEPHRKIDCVLFVSAVDEQPATRLMSIVQQAISTSKHSSVNKIPIVSVTTKSDVLSEEDSSVLEKSRGIYQYSLEHSFPARDPERGFMEHTPRKVVNYFCELEPFSDESANPSSVEPSLEKDTQLLAVWRDIIARTTACGGGDKRKRAYSTPSSSRGQMCSCLPFKFDYMRLRSGSF